MSLPFGLLRRIDAHLGDYLFQKSRTAGSFPDTFSRSSSSSLYADEGLFEQPEPLASSKAVMEKILRRRSMQLYDQQQAWQVHLTLTYMEIYHVYIVISMHPFLLAFVINKFRTYLDKFTIPGWLLLIKAEGYFVLHFHCFKNHMGSVDQIGITMN